MNEEIIEKARTMTAVLPYSKEAIEFMISRGFDTPAKIRNFLEFNPAMLRSMPLMNDAGRFIARVLEAVNNKEHIVVYGDYDCDGVMGTAIAIKVLRMLGAECDYFINNRVTEGFGMNTAGMQKLHGVYPDAKLIITVDNGIASAEGIAWAAERGIDTVVSDHHVLPETASLPKCPVVDEWRTDEYEADRECMCGAELIRRLMIETVKSAGRYDELKDELDKLVSLSGCATIADSVPMTAANHYIASEGLKHINAYDYPCWKAAREIMISGSGKLDSSSIGFYFGPMINAASRMTGEAGLAVEFALADSDKEAETYAMLLKKLNEQRRSATAKYTAEAESEIAASGRANDHFLIAQGNGDIPAGIAGLVCSSVVSNHHVPAVCLSPSDDPDIMKGSGRSAGGFDLKAALDKCAPLLVTYGGHKEACGLTIRKENIEMFRNIMDVFAETYCRNTDMEEHIDFYIEPADLSMKMINEFTHILAPFGTGFEAPAWSLTGELKSQAGETYHTVGKNTVKFTLKRDGAETDCIWFGGKPRTDKMRSSGIMQAKGTPSINSFNGHDSIQFIVRDAECL